MPLVILSRTALRLGGDLILVGLDGFLGGGGGHAAERIGRQSPEAFRRQARNLPCPLESGDQAGRAQALALNGEAEVERAFGDFAPVTLFAGEILKLAAFDVGPVR